jgi:hypothetical protein
VTSDAPLSAIHLRAPLVTTFATRFGLTEGEVRTLPARKGRPADPRSAASRLNEVARVAREAAYGKRTATVAEAFDVQPGYARQLIGRAKAAGFQTW